MYNCIIFDTSYGSFNMGDYIINECANYELKDIINNNFCVRLGTHTPVAHFYQLNNKRKPVKFINNAKYKFITGTNIIKKNLFWPWPDWNINLFNSKPYKNSILVGVGLSGKRKKANLYTKLIYRRIFSKDYIHSTRDEKTKLFLESLGLKAINTGCPTLWSIDDELCNKIPNKKCNTVIFTLTDYCKDKQKDQDLINILVKNYKNLYFWPQGSNDYEYLKSFQNIENIKIISPNIESYNDFLNNTNTDYVGTRLHAGIYAIRHKKRTIILSVDNRARDMKETYNLPTIERDNISQLDKMINSSFKTNIKIDKEKINKWKNQFN